MTVLSPESADAAPAGGSESGSAEGRASGSESAEGRASASRSAAGSGSAEGRASASGSTLRGIPVSPGAVAAPVAKLAAPPRLPDTQRPVTDASAEEQAAQVALAEVADDLEARASRADKTAADVLAAQAMMVRDPELADRVARAVRDGSSAPFAVNAAFGSFRDLLASLGGYLGERAADLDDLRDRVVARLLGLPMPGLPDPGHPYVLVADDLAPADTASLDPETVVAIVTERGGPTSHTAILARALGVPAVVACAGVLDLEDGVSVLVDGATGAVRVDPAADEVAEATEAASRARAEAALVSGPGRTADGHAVKLLVNIGALGDLDAAAAADSEGVGLFRTEFLFLDKETEPGVEEQRAAYAKVFAAFAGRRVVVRTLDAGADKPLAFAATAMAAEPNPALGVRGLRTSRRLPDLLERQLTALADAVKDAAATVWVMAPMVSTPSEAADFTRAARGHGLPVAGSMIEVPAAALRAEAVIEHCEFLSLGTNDLAQYTFAADRMLGDLADLLDPWQPALLELVGRTAQAGVAAGKPVGVCGEAAADPLLAPVLVGLGVNSLSMAPVALNPVRATLAKLTLDQCRTLARRALAAPDAATAREQAAAAVREWTTSS
jgi:phosphoenolpyruvate-protein phosphotransferase (PTS system enzyme I)